MDPEQIYQEVLQEEQQKGSHPSVAEGRAKAARARAEHGSPHPKEPRWWPGSQPHLEGGAPAEAAAAEPEPEPEPAPEPEAAPAEESAPVAEAPAAEAPAPETPVAAPTEVAVAPASQQTTEAPPPSAEPAQPAAAVAAAPEPVSATQPAPTLPSGVTHGTTGGTRLRPEDEVATESQFAGQQAMYERRKLIDDLVATGVPSVAAAGTGRSRAPWLALFYLIIPIVVVVLLVNNNNTSASAGGGPAPSASAPVAGGGLTITAHNVAFDTSDLTVPASGGKLSFVNQDSTTHNFAVFKDKSATDQLFKSPDVSANQTVELTLPKLDKGTYYFECQYHPTSMNGTLTVK